MKTKKQTTIELGHDEEAPVVPLEQKYKEQMRQIFPQKIELPISTLPDMIKEQIDLRPDFQRRDIWKPNKQSRFIESIIMNVPIPPVFLGEDDYGKYVVLDGRQRLTAVREFLANSYRLEGLSVWDELNNSSFHDLQKKGLDKTITRRFIPAVLILKESSSEVKYDVFDRLNTGGVIAEPMEIRNAIHRGEFNKLLHTLSEELVFRKLWDIPLDPDERASNTAYSRMEDLELVLRFFALQEYKSFAGMFKDYLSRFMAKRNTEYKEKHELKEQDKELFRRAITNSWNIFGEDAFRKPIKTSNKKSVKSAPLADAVMFSLAPYDPSQITKEIAGTIRAELEALFTSDPKFRQSIGTGTNGKGATTYRLETAAETVRKVLKGSKQTL